VPARKFSAIALKSRSRSQRGRPRDQVNSILERREKLVAEVSSLRNLGTVSAFIENAQQLLTRWWSSASWNGREELLNAADWLIRLEKQRAHLTQPPM
jgi:hypothetical protein